LAQLVDCTEHSPKTTPSSEFRSIRHYWHSK